MQRVYATDMPRILCHFSSQKLFNYTQIDYTFLCRMQPYTVIGSWSLYTEKTIFPIPITLNGIWSWWRFSFRFWTKSYPIRCERNWKYSFFCVRSLVPGRVDARNTANLQLYLSWEILLQPIHSNRAKIIISFCGIVQIYTIGPR